MNEQLLITLEIEEYSPLVINKGKKIANAFEADLSILLLFKENDDNNGDEVEFIKRDIEMLSKHSISINKVWFGENIFTHISSLK